MTISESDGNSSELEVVPSKGTLSVRTLRSSQQQRQSGQAISFHRGSRYQRNTQNAESIQPTDVNNGIGPSNLTDVPCLRTEILPVQTADNTYSNDSRPILNLERKKITRRMGNNVLHRKQVQQIGDLPTQQQTLLNLQTQRAQLEAELQSLEDKIPRNELRDDAAVSSTSSYIEVNLWPTQDVGRQTCIFHPGKDMLLANLDGQSFAFKRALSDSNLLSSGYIKLSVHGSKSLKNSAKDAYIFSVLSGAVRVTIHKSEFVISKGGFFCVPRGNFYALENCVEYESILFFGQSRIIAQ